MFTHVITISSEFYFLSVDPYFHVISFWLFLEHFLQHRSDDDEFFQLLYVWKSLFHLHFWNIFSQDTNFLANGFFFFHFLPSCIVSDEKSAVVKFGKLLASASSHFPLFTCLMCYQPHTVIFHLRSRIWIILPSLSPTRSCVLVCLTAFSTLSPVLSSV